MDVSSDEVVDSSEMESSSRSTESLKPRPSTPNRSEISDQVIPALYRLVEAPENAERMERETAAATHEFHYVTLDRSRIHGKDSVFWRPGDRGLRLPLPDGTEVRVVIDSTEARGPDQFVSRGRLAGVPGGRATFAVAGESLSASIEGLSGGELKLRSLGDSLIPGGVVQLYVVDPELHGNCGTGVHSSARTLGFTLGSEDRPALSESPAAVALLESGQGIVDVLLVYSGAVRQALGGVNNVVTELELAAEKVNVDLERSEISARIRVAGIREVNYPGDSTAGGLSGWQGTSLDRLRGVTDGFMDEVHAMRDELGADLVSLVLRRSDPASSGIAYILDEVGAFYQTHFAYSVVNYAGVSDSAVLSHELGHNFGCAHARGDAGATGENDGAYAYSYGYRFNATDSGGRSRQLRTIMAYSPGSRIPYFSNPRIEISATSLSGLTVSFPGQPAVGVPEGAALPADNARTIEQTAFQVAGNRLAPDRSGAGRMVNVSTRALVGPGVQALVGGFVISGEGTQRVLVRAAGPVLGEFPFTVPGALANSRLQVTALDGALVGQNDDWGQPAPNGFAVAAAAADAGAFPFANGSRDAALVLELSPGPYTAVVSGVGGATGIALMEAYEIEAGGSTRLLNISTRGYADLERPMFAGFVVERDPLAGDVAKTMFIRVRGPSLVNYGLNEADVMGDPMIEIYDENAELIFVNDDWDPPTLMLGNDIPTIERGEVDQPSEALVYAAAERFGLTDMVPTEPGVVLALPPGLYTVLVKPFEDLDRDNPQLAEPGVAIVEVFELVD